MPLKISSSSFFLFCCSLEARIGPPNTRKYLPELQLCYNSANFQVVCPHLLHSTSNLLKLLRLLQWRALFLGKQQSYGHLGTLDKTWQWGWPWGPNQPDVLQGVPTVGKACFLRIRKKLSINTILGKSYKAKHWTTKSGPCSFWFCDIFCILSISFAHFKFWKEISGKSSYHLVSLHPSPRRPFSGEVKKNFFECWWVRPAPTSTELDNKTEHKGSSTNKFLEANRFFAFKHKSL